MHLQQVLITQDLRLMQRLIPHWADDPAPALSIATQWACTFVCKAPLMYYMSHGSVTGSVTVWHASCAHPP